MRKIVLTFLYIVTFLFLLNGIKANALPEEFKNSVGQIKFQFEPTPIEIYDQNGVLIGRAEISEKNCNGFLVQKQGKYCFVSVLHLSKIFADGKILPLKGGGFYKVLEGRDFPKTAVINVPNRFRVEVTLDKKNFYDGDQLPKEKRKADNETIDVSCIDITDYLDESAKSNVLEYNQLAGENKKSEIDNSSGNVIICGYPGGELSTGYAKLPVNMILPINFGELVDVGNGEFPSGFAFKPELKSGDCGRPIVLKIDNEYYVIGLLKTSRKKVKDSVAIDSTAIKRVIDETSSK